MQVFGYGILAGQFGIASRRDHLEVVNYGTATNFVAYDGNGNVAALVNAADGTVTANYEYGPFGEPIRMTGLQAKSNPFRFSTKYDDDESDLLYYGYRYYKPATGSWASRDPIEEQSGFNLYTLVGNFPTCRFDTLGLCSCTLTVSDLVKSHSDDKLKTLLKQNIVFTDPGQQDDRVINGFIYIGEKGGSLGFAFLARTICGDKLKINAINNQSDTEFEAEWNPATKALDLNAAYSHYEYLNPDELALLGDFPDSGPITIAHELGHAYIGLLDPFNVYVVENVIRRAFGRPPRQRYDPYVQDDPSKRGDGTGLIWEAPLGLATEVPAETWWNDYIASQKARNAFIIKWRP